MILSKKYKEELNKIIMDEDMKKRILNNVLNENVETKSIVPTIKKYINRKRNMQLAAACFTAVACLGLVKSYPEFFKHEKNNIEQSQAIKDSEDKNKVRNNNNKERESGDDKDHPNGNSLDSTNNNADIGKHENIETDISKNENNKKSNPVKNENNNLGNKENSLELGQKEKRSDNSQIDTSSMSKIYPEQQTNEDASAVNFSIAAKTNSEPQINANNEAINRKSLDNNLKDEAKNYDESILKKNKMKNDLRKSSLEARGYSIEEYKTLEEAEAVVKLKINPVTVLPKGFSMTNISVITNAMIQIEYSNEHDGITFRAGKDIENISGDYNEYEIKNTFKINEININLDGNKNKVYNLATWKKEGISYSISSAMGIDEETILNMIRSSL
jgi:hypothetical protein